MPYRIDVLHPSQDALDRLVQLGALDIEELDAGLAAIIPDGVTPMRWRRPWSEPRRHLPVVARDDGSVWLLNPRAVLVGSVVIAPPEVAAPPAAIRFYRLSGLWHRASSNTALCIEALEEALAIAVPESVLDVGTGSGLLALAALVLVVPQAVGVDIDADALEVAAENARLNNLVDRLQLLLGGPDAVSGVWPLVLTNVLAAPLIKMAPVLVRRVGSRGRLILSGIPWSLESEVRQAYERLGMRYLRSEKRAGWIVLMLQASW